MIFRQIESWIGSVGKKSRNDLGSPNIRYSHFWYCLLWCDVFMKSFDNQISGSSILGLSFQDPDWKSHLYRNIGDDEGDPCARLVLTRLPSHWVEFGNNFRAGHMKLNLVKFITYETTTQVYNYLTLVTVVVWSNIEWTTRREFVSFCSWEVLRVYSLKLTRLLGHGLHTGRAECTVTWSWLCGRC